MAVLKQWRCAVHGTFESSDESPLCASGCDTIERVFLTPPGIGSSRTKNIDATLERVASNFGMTDISNRGGRAAKGVNPGFQKRQEEFNEMIRAKYGNGPWGHVPEGATFNTKTQQVERVEGRNGSGAPGALAEHHAPAANELAGLKPAELAMGISAKPIKAIRDPDNLTLAAARPAEVEHQNKAA